MKQEQMKLIAKYAVNIMAIISALIIGLDPIWGIPMAKEIIDTLAVIMGVMGTYLIGTKTVASIQKGKE